MNILLDTHTLLWWAEGERLTEEAARVVADPDNLAFVSAVSIWEISIKSALGKLSVDGDIDAIAVEDFEALNIGFAHARLAGELPRHHRDPFDRLLIAQARLEGLTILTRDAVFSQYDVEVLAV